MNRPWKIWLVFAVSSAVVLGVMGWVSAIALRLDRAQAESRGQAELEERTRLALWRMDSMLGPLIAQESARPYFAYQPFHASDRAYGKMFNALDPGEVLMPSPLLTQTPTNVLLHFQFTPEGRLTSPQVPEGNQRDLAEAHFITHDQIELAARRLREFEQLLNAQASPETVLRLVLSGTVTNPASIGPTPSNRELLLACAPQSGSSTNLLVGNLFVSQRLDDFKNTGTQALATKSQQVRNDEELQARAQSVQQAYDLNLMNWAGARPQSSRTEVAEDVLRPVWLGEAVVLARRVSVRGRVYVQGCWLDWPGIRHWLLSSVKDLLPDANLEYIKGGADDPQARLLATLPVRLLPGTVPPDSQTRTSPVLFALATAWVCVLVAGVCVALLMQGAVSLSERRAAFVSAVTHELRTPLTTFKMYSEMLAANMVPTETKRREYLDGLCAEANRLNHLVENVLAYARLERGSARGRVERVSLRELIERVKPRLEQRAEQAGMRLQEDAESCALETQVEVDVAAVEQILFNLVDNACKYAAPSAAEKIIHLEAFAEDEKFALLRVRDHGQGISAEAAKRLFQPFSKSADEAARSAPGVGLGLALCRRLGRSLGGDLRLNNTVKRGACFELLLPLNNGS